MKVLIGTNNPGKFADAERMAVLFEDVTVLRPQDVGISGDPVETGETYRDNAHIKRDYYLGELRRLGIDDMYVIGDDSGIEIDALGGEPGVHSRRWRDGVTPMSDQEVVDYCLERMRDIPDEERGAAFVGNLAIGDVTGGVDHDITYELRGVLVHEPASIDDIPGYPFRALFYLPEFGVLLKDAEQPGGRPTGFLTHRERGMQMAFTYLQQHIAGQGRSQ